MTPKMDGVSWQLAGNPCDVCGADVWITRYWHGEPSQKWRVQHGDNPEHSRFYGDGFAITEGYYPWINEIHKRDEVPQ